MEFIPYYNSTYGSSNNNNLQVAVAICHQPIPNKPVRGTSRVLGARIGTGRGTEESGVGGFKLAGLAPPHAARRRFRRLRGRHTRQCRHSPQLHRASAPLEPSLAPSRGGLPAAGTCSFLPPPALKSSPPYAHIRIERKIKRFLI